MTAPKRHMTGIRYRIPYNAVNFASQLYHSKLSKVSIISVSAVHIAASSSRLTHIGLNYVVLTQSYQAPPYMLWFIGSMVLRSTKQTLDKVNSIFTNSIISNSFGNPINIWLAIGIMGKSFRSQCQTIFEFYQLFYSQTIRSFTQTVTS